MSSKKISLLFVLNGWFKVTFSVFCACAGALATTSALVAPINERETNQPRESLRSPTWLPPTGDAYTFTVALSSGRPPFGT